MHAKEELIEKITVSNKSEKQSEEINIKNEKKKGLGKLKRKYQIMIIFIVFLSLIVGFMILPVIIAVYLNP
ncbi:MAG: hypothetical protein ACFE9Z_07250 [Promethearchaeota archaeon]